MHLDIGPLYDKITREDQDRRRFGYLPLMASCSDGELGALNAESYAERIISCANLILDDGNTLLGDQELEMLVVLRMNRSFMLHMRQNYSKEVKHLQPFNQTVVDTEVPVVSPKK